MKEILDKLIRKEEIADMDLERALFGICDNNHDALELVSVLRYTWRISDLVEIFGFTRKPLALIED